jgi:hypothetical protein
MFSDVWKAAAIAGWCAFALALVGALYLNGELRDLEREAGGTEQGLGVCGDTNAGEAVVVADLTARLEACTGAKAAHLVELETLRYERATARHQAQADFNRERQEREELYGTDQECGALRRVPVCAGLSDRLRAGAGGGAHGGAGGAGAGADPR